MSAAGYLKRLEQISRSIRHGNAKTIVVSVPIQLVPVEDSVEVDAIVTDETRAVVDEILQATGIGEQDTVIEIARYTGELPELISVT